MREARAAVFLYEIKYVFARTKAVEKYRHRADVKRVRTQKQYQQNAYGQNRSEEKEGKQTIINKNSHSKNPEATKQVGEYIDYEEV